MARYYTPLRYPGGKSKLANYVKTVFRENGLCDGHYMEPYAGGAGVALELLMTEYAGHIHLNDLNLPLYSFWDTVLNDTEELCRKISSCKISLPNWKRQKRIIASPEEYSKLELGFAFFFLNRTNRSGIISGGVIGGLEQLGEWKIDARFNRKELIRRIELIAEYRDSISLYNLDAFDLVKEVVPSLPNKTLVYLDPPYYVKGQRLYDNHYKHDDHAKIARVVQRYIKQPWIVSYDNCERISELYKQRRQHIYTLNYSASRATVGSEIMIYGDSVEIPEVDSAVFRIAS